MTAWKALTKGQKMTVGHVFNALDALDDLSPKMEQTRIGFSDLFAYVSGMGGLSDVDLKKALLQDRKLRSDWDRLINRVTRYHGPQVAAASSGEINRREGEGFTIQLKTSKAETDQVYVLITLLDAEAPPPKNLFISGESDCFSRHELPQAVGGVMQILTQEGSTLVKGLKDIASEIYLK